MTGSALPHHSRTSRLLLALGLAALAVGPAVAVAAPAPPATPLRDSALPADARADVRLERMKTWTRAALVAAPAPALALAGLVHPSDLDASTAHRWWTLHVVLLPVFPLLGGSVWLLLRGERGPVPALARLAAYGFATFYTGLDLVAGLAAGLAYEQEGSLTPTVGRLFDVGNQLGAVGVWSLALSGVLAGVALRRRHGWRVLPGTLVLTASCYPFLVNHIFHPRGVLSVLGIGAGLALIAVGAVDRDGGCPDRPVGAIIPG